MPGPQKIKGKEKMNSEDENEGGIIRVEGKKKENENMRGGAES